MKTERGLPEIFAIGDKVAHPGHGGCTIQGICRRDIGGVEQQYFVLVPKTEPQTTILAPVGNTEKMRLRKIISAEKADQLLTYFSVAEVEWVSDQSKRRQVYETTLRDGTLSDLAKMIKELTVQETHTKLSNGDREILPKARKKLFSEIALAKGIEFERALDMAIQAM